MVRKCGAPYCVTRSDGEEEDAWCGCNKSASFTHPRFYHSAGYCTEVSPIKCAVRESSVRMADS